MRSLPNVVRFTVKMRMLTDDPDPSHKHLIDVQIEQDATNLSGRFLINKTCEMLSAENVKQRLAQWAHDVVDEMVRNIRTTAAESSAEMANLVDRLTKP